MRFSSEPLCVGAQHAAPPCPYRRSVLSPSSSLLLFDVALTFMSANSLENRFTCSQVSVRTRPLRNHATKSGTTILGGA